MSLAIKDLKQAKGVSMPVRRHFFHSPCETYSTQEHELIAQWSRNKANMEVYRTVLSVAFLPFLSPSLESEHWSQQNTFFYLFFPPLLILSNLPYPKPCTYKAQHPAGVSGKHQCTQSQEPLSNISIVSSVMQDEKTKVKSQGRKSIGFISVSWCWCGCQCFLEFVHIRKRDLCKFLLILSQWQWLTAFSSPNVRSADKPEFFSFPCYCSPTP